MKDGVGTTKPFICRLLALWLSVPAAIVVVGLLPIDDNVRDTQLPMLLLVLVWPLAGIVSLFWAAQLVGARRWLQAVAALALPAFIAASVLLPGFDLSNPVIETAFNLNRQLHFVTMKNDYDARIAALHTTPPRLKLFVWEMDPIGGSGVVYDGSDDIALPRNRRPRNWAHRETTYPAALEELCRIDAVGSHYYIVFFGC